MYPQDGIAGYPREAFLDDLVAEAASEIRGCLERGAIVQIDFTEARLSLKLDPSKGLLDSFVDLNNRVLGAAHATRSGARVGVHTCPGGDQDSTHSADVDYADLLPGAVPPECRHVLRPARQRGRPRRGCSDPRRARDREPPDLRRRDRPDRPAHRDGGGGPRPRARGGPVHRPGPPGHDRRLRLLAVRRRRSTSRDTAFAKIRARIERERDGIEDARRLSRRSRRRRRARRRRQPSPATSAVVSFARVALQPGDDRWRGRRRRPGVRRENQSIVTAFSIARPGSVVGAIGARTTSRCRSRR